ncbi:MBL fold metallo-hydrolase [Conexibacter woesei]|uniref:Beta-lactamase domain protein n=1 Tax=Conexibacter woesei (strain DSM 14684 / CCUG 47730 / CIP 108061 / JCM 11494 / NBRC 100937 / ID131577) TaxID=469383 RepID=D3FCK9_CONWI|nr:MBL fold metallo-hydrolase [Conexibacter woesei]ADB49482.1 beta-lactamase domain protein [Conexibacter woesei DSM 14684]
MIIERTMSDGFLTNTYLVADGPDGSAVLIDAGGGLEPLLDAIERERLTLTTILLTHHHGDHVQELDRVLERFPGTPVLIHELEQELVPQATGTIVPGEPIPVGGLRIDPLHTPGHTLGMVSLLVSDGHQQALFTGDTLFKGSVGGVRAPGHTTYEDIKSSIMDKLLQFPPDTPIHPGHTDPTTVGAEKEENRFVRIWRGLDPEGSEPCTALGEPATLVLLGDDYDGGHKAWIRWPDGRDDIVPGSKVETQG